MTMRHYSDAAITLSAAGAGMIMALWNALTIMDRSKKLKHRTIGLIKADRLLMSMLEDRS